MTRVDVVVVGGGVMGASAAWWLARRGRRVLVLEQFAQGHSNGSSHGTERIFRLTHADPFWPPLGVVAHSLWRELELDADEQLMLTTGHIDFGSASELKLRAQAAASAGVATALLGPEELSARWPGMSTTAPVLFHDQGARTNAAATVAAMLRRTVELGGEVRFESPVRALRQVAGGVEADLDSEMISADVAVVAAAGWTPLLLDGVVSGVPTVECSTGQVAFFQPLVADAEWPTFVSPEVYGMSTPDGRVRVGHFQHGVPTHPDHRSFATDPHTRSEIERWVATHLPGVAPANVGELSCLFGETADDDYVIDRHGNVVVGCGFGGHGFKFAPLIGRMLADLAGGTGSVEPRFALGR